MYICLHIFVILQVMFDLWSVLLLEDETTRTTPVPSKQISHFCKASCVCLCVCVCVCVCVCEMKLHIPWFSTFIILFLG